MPRFLAFLLLLLPAVQDPPPAPDLPALKAAKLKSAFLSKAPWLVDFAKAKEAAAASGRPIFAYVTRSFAS